MVLPVVQAVVPVVHQVRKQAEQAQPIKAIAVVTMAVHPLVAQAAAALVK
jgi:S-adenosylhomocysteine hydrolase